MQKYRKGLENALVTVLLILVAIAAVSLISYYFFGVLRHSMITTGLSISNVQMVGGILTGDLINQGASNITSITIQVRPQNNATVISNFTNSSLNIPPGHSYAFTLAVPKAIEGNNYVITVLVKYDNGQTYATSVEVIDQ
ncbi:hypothetical protein SULI_02495 [Saccharolobus solfataricus]|uniref:Uncharacterized protein n=3 Tax=Saccharolobus solfataricus TaxID=2287 RepID=Q97VE5_SACS2|nr:hypothetical protein [Saccharolobus solfataricus]AAK42799.1 Hypothetical protein SSO2681 [Saccharolobus solfataricus P2]AKA72890.1 hypothetical protein SULB_0488 [Saccharolobus solfataricus]AKA75589.1 hypothetical protein SULC_0486 [Saccharolobus solfataricus]AKA78282.1 hypothetical protein SULA_0486 [Saccharolobus solfataricus]AZF67400.1 hypothetical protein SULG_02495 [Saccharolobus solfataricus]